MTAVAVATRPRNCLLLDYGGVLSSPPLDALDAFERSQNLPAGTMEGAILGTPPGWSEGHTPWELLELGLLDFDEFVEIVARTVEHTVGRGRFDRAAYRRFELDTPVTTQAPLVNVTRWLRSQGVRCGIVTNNVREFSPVWRRTVPMDLFDVVVESWQTQTRKPSVRLWLEAADQLGVSPDAVVAVDDQQRNLDAVALTGMGTVLAGADPVATATAILNAFN